MKNPNPNDLYSVRLQSLVSDDDIQFLFDLYQPIIGAKACAIYMNFLYSKDQGNKTFASLYDKMMISPGEFYGSMPSLEAMGLVKTFIFENKGTKGYVFCLYCPCNPRSFFDNVLFLGLLRQHLSEEEIQLLAKRYSLPEEPNQKLFEDVSISFRDYFAPDLSKITSSMTIKTGGKKKGTIGLYFDKQLFLSTLASLDPRFCASSFSPKDYIKIARMATLYNYTSEAMAGFVAKIYAFGAQNRLDYDKLQDECVKSLDFSYLKEEKKPETPNQVKGNSGLANMIRAMEEMSPVEFLHRLQKGNEPAKGDVELIDHLIVDMGLSKPACNALIFYMMEKKGGRLNRKYMEKVAANMVRNDVTNAYDAFNFFVKTPSKFPSKGKNDQTKPAEEKEIKVHEDGEVSMSELKESMDFFGDESEDDD
ncbi:MAG: hypothetical protein K5694_01070 [Bacilli bacterium]|nr:hypothetical protein [Bacilli bacterium]